MDDRRHLDAPDVERLRDAYLEPWGGSEYREPFELALRLGPFAHAFKELSTLGEVPEWANRKGPVSRAFRGGARRIRTADLLGAIQALSQLSYSPAAT